MVTKFWIHGRDWVLSEESMTFTCRFVIRLFMMEVRGQDIIHSRG